MTPREVLDCNRGARWRERREWERVAWLGSLVIAPHVKHPPSVRKLLSWLGPEDDVAERARKAKGGPPDKSEDGIRAWLAEMARAHKRKAWALLKDEFADEAGRAEGNGEKKA